MLTVPLLYGCETWFLTLRKKLRPGVCREEDAEDGIHDRAVGY